MFVELAPLLTNTTLVLTIATLGHEILVTVVPQPIDPKADNALKTPLSITATAAELDAEFPAALTAYTNSHRSLAETIANAQADMATAEKSIKASTAAKQALASKARTQAAKAKPGAVTGNLFPAAEPEPTEEEDETDAN